MNRNRLLLAAVIVAAAATPALIACSSDDAASGPMTGGTPDGGGLASDAAPLGDASTSTPDGATPIGPDGSASAVTTVHVSAAQGGTVSDPTGATALVIPPGALATDTDITLTQLPKSGSAVVGVSEFGPDGLQFSKPVQLTIKADAALAPANKTLAVAVNDGADFKAVDGSTFANGAASASITHFSRYTVVVIDGKLVLQPPATCAAARTGFTPCGGDLRGTWKFGEFCAATTAIGNGTDICPENSVDIDYQINRDVVIDTSTIVTGAGTNTIVATYNYFLDCFNRTPDAGKYDSGLNDCAAVQATFYTSKNQAGTCVDKGNGYCACTETTVQQAPADAPQTYTTSGTSVTITKTADGGTKTSTSDYCVTGNLATVRETGNDGGAANAQIYVLERK